MSSFAWLCAALTVFGMGYQCFMLVAALRYFRHAARWTALPDYLPPVTLLKPLKGATPELLANLESFCRQDYPAYQIVFGVDSPDDPAIAAVRRLQRAFPERDLVLSVGSRDAVNGKVGTLLQMVEHALHPVLVLSDADIRVTPDYLRTVVRPLQRPEVGISTCFYRGRGRFGLPTLFESLFITTDFVPMAFVGHWIGIRAAYGATIAMRRDALDAAGGFGTAADQLADDYVLGRHVIAAGYEMAVLPYVVDTVLEADTLGEVWRHQMRWARTYRACQATGWLMASLVQMTTWACLFWIATGGAAPAPRLLLAALGTRFTVLAVIVYLLRDREAALSLWLLPVKDVIMSAIWLVSWLGREVEWSGQRFRVEASGRLIRLPAPTCPEPSLAAPSP